jgi:hypothetical protein
MAITMNLTLAKILVCIGGALVISALVLYLLIFQYPYYFLYFQDSNADKAIIEKRVAELGWRIEHKAPFVFIANLASGSLYSGNDCEKKCIDLLSEDRVGEIVANNPENFKNFIIDNQYYIYTKNILRFKDTITKRISQIKEKTIIMININVINIRNIFIHYILNLKNLNSKNFTKSVHLTTNTS